MSRVRVARTHRRGKPGRRTVAHADVVHAELAEVLSNAEVPDLRAEADALNADALLLACPPEVCEEVLPARVLFHVSDCLPCDFVLFGIM